MGLVTAGKNTTNRMLRSLGVQLVRTETIDRLRTIDYMDQQRKAGSLEQTEKSPKSSATEQVDNSFRSSLEANIFRMTPRDGEPTETVSRTFLNTLLRESAALRVQGDELVSLRRAVQIMSASAAPVERSSGNSDSGDGLTPDGGIYTSIYDYDGLRNDPHIIHNHDFMRDSRFVAAYKRALLATEVDHRYYWRVHVALWCASVALSLEGDFVECGVWRGLLSTAIVAYFGWNNIDRKFFLFDTFRGVDERQLADEEIYNIAHFRIGYGEDIYDHVVKNFREFKNVEVVRGSVPDTLPTANIGKVAYLSIDMNNAAPEIAAANYFWDRLSPGAPILLDDYGFVRYEAQKKAFDAFAEERGVQILALPTGQGLMIKPRS